jgi:hypothetical protein
MKLNLVIYMLFFVGCGIYFGKEFIGENESPFLDDYGWQIIPNIEKIRKCELNDRYHVKVSVSRVVDIGKNLFRESEFDARVVEIKILLPDTFYIYTTECWEDENDKVGKKFYYYQPRERSLKDVERLPYIKKKTDAIILNCIVEYTHIKNGSSFQKKYSFKMKKDRYIDVYYLFGV